jgi:hypothetical protein
MAKALFGHVGVGTDMRLAAEVRRLRGRVEQLEAELARTCEAHEALLSSVSGQPWVDDDLRMLVLPDDQPAYT